jgi:transposase
MTTIAPELLPAQSVSVFGGVDTHADTHTAAVIDGAGRLLDHRQFPATPGGYAELTGWLADHGQVQRVGVEGTGVYGAGLARHLTAAGIELVEVDRPDRKTRRFAGKSDPIDAEAAARAALSGRQTGTPKTRTGPVEALRALRVARRSAIAARAEAQTRIKALIITAPEPLRAQLRAMTTRRLLTTCAALGPDLGRIEEPEQATKAALRTLARRHAQLTTEINELDAQLAPLVEQINPALNAANGVGIDVAGQLLVTAGDNPERLRSEAAFAALCGVSPIPASSGRTHRHRLNRGGDRQANAAIYRVVLCRMRWDPRTRAYVETPHERRTVEEGHHPLPQASDRPRALLPAHLTTAQPSGLTIHRSIPAAARRPRWPAGRHVRRERPPGRAATAAASPRARGRPRRDRAGMRHVLTAVTYLPHRCDGRPRTPAGTAAAWCRPGGGGRPRAARRRRPR